MNILDGDYELVSFTDKQGNKITLAIEKYQVFDESFQATQHGKACNGIKTKRRLILRTSNTTYSLIRHIRTKKLMTLRKSFGNERLASTTTGIEHRDVDIINVPAIEPPSHAAYILRFLPRDIRDVVIGDMEEQYQIIYKTHSERHARFWYWSQTFTSFCPFMWAGVKRLLGAGIFGWLYHAVRHFLT